LPRYPCPVLSADSLYPQRGLAGGEALTQTQDLALKRCALLGHRFFPHQTRGPKLESRDCRLVPTLHQPLRVVVLALSRPCQTLAQGRRRRSRSHVRTSPETAEELTVDVFHDVWRRASTYHVAIGTVLGWIMNEARSRAIDRLRFGGRKKRHSDGAAEPSVDCSSSPRRGPMRFGPRRWMTTRDSPAHSACCSRSVRQGAQAVGCACCARIAVWSCLYCTTGKAMP
jgi:hypothetical protein